jgi:hypothetical protein
MRRHRLADRSRACAVHRLLVHRCHLRVHLWIANVRLWIVQTGISNCHAWLHTDFRRVIVKACGHVAAHYDFRLGITVSTIPAVLIKLYRAKREINRSEETSSSSSSSDIESVGLPLRQFLHLDALDPILRKQLRSLPSPQHLRVRAYVILIAVILTTCCTIYVCSFIAVGLWLNAYYDLYDFSTTNTTISPFYASVVIAVTSFNQNGLAVW